MKSPSCVLACVVMVSLLTPCSARADLAPFNGVGITFAHIHLFAKTSDPPKVLDRCHGRKLVTNGPLQ